MEMRNENLETRLSTLLVMKVIYIQVLLDLSM